jgi:cytochrome c oxidase accessory protein FixG
MSNAQHAIPIKIIDASQGVKAPKPLSVAQPDNNKIYARAVKGAVETFRRLFGALFLFIFSGLPWLTYNGQQAILLDFSEQRFRLFNITLWPQDLVLVSWIFIIAAFVLFIITTVVGRVWCGFMCPQTVYTFVFIWLEEKIEGSRNKRILLDKQKLSLNKASKKLLKHAAWIGVALLTALSFVGYFVPIKALFIEFFTLEANFWPTFYVLFFTFCTYGNAGWMREIMCTHMCPYSRFQSAMFDKDTVTVTYDSLRGEGRGPRPKKRSHEQNKASGLGDCIDCNLCVQVCPTGIDIRNGLQYECINCGACVDACNHVMGKMNYKEGLIKFTSESALAGKKVKLLRPKVVGYLFVCLVIVAVMAVQFMARSELEVNVVRDRTSLYRENNLGLIDNTYTLILINKSQAILNVNIGVSGLNYIESIGSFNLSLAPGEVLKHPITLTLAPSVIEETITSFEFVVQANNLNEEPTVVTQESTFIYR